MYFEGVSFNSAAIKQMNKKDFVDAHKGVLWQDREPAEREKMLSDVYDAIAGKKAKQKKEELSEAEATEESD